MLLILPTVTALAGNTTPRKPLQLKQISAPSTRNRLWILPSNSKMETPIELLQCKKICRQHWYPTKHLHENTAQVNLISGGFSPPPSLLNGNIPKSTAAPGVYLEAGKGTLPCFLLPPCSMFLEPSGISRGQEETKRQKIRNCFTQRSSHYIWVNMNTHRKKEMWKKNHKKIKIIRRSGKS